MVARISLAILGACALKTMGVMRTRNPAGGPEYTSRLFRGGTHAP